MSKGTARTVRRLTGWALLVAAVGLAGWTFWLGATLGIDEHRWHWVGIDVLEVIGLAATGLLVLGPRVRRACLPALLTAALFAQDACLDVVSAHGSAGALVTASVMALAAELPAAVLLTWVAWRCLSRATR